MTNATVVELQPVLPEEVQEYVGNNNVQRVIAMMSNGRTLSDISGHIIKPAAISLANAFNFIVYDYGLPDLSQPKSAPLTDSIAMRALVMMRCIWRYENQPDRTKSTISAGRYKGLEFIAPRQEELCSEKNGYSGLIQDAYEELRLDKVGYPSSMACSGAPHIQASAHLLSHAGLLLARGAGRDYIEGDGFSVRIPYALTDEGRVLSYWMFGDYQYIANGSVRGYTGIPAVVISRSSPKYSAWLEFVGVDS